MPTLRFRLGWIAATLLTAAVAIPATSAAAPSGALTAGAPVSATTPEVVLVGDSIVALNLGDVERSLREHRVPSWRVAAQSGRRTTTRLAYGTTIESGLDAIAAARAAGADPELWVVELGTNDLGEISRCGCADRRGFARQRILTVLEAIGPGHHVAWVNVRHGGYPSLAALFNDVLAELARTRTDLTVLDWYARSEGRSSWFGDGIHPSGAGAVALADLIASGAAALLPRWVVPPLGPLPADPPPPPVTTGVGVAAATSPAVRLQPPRLPVGGTTIRDRCGALSGYVAPGASGAAVVAVQCALVEHGLDPGPVDGTFSSDTKDAVLTFQRYQGLASASGVVNTSTARSLGLTVTE